MSRFKTVQRILKAVTILSALGGLLIVFLANTPLFDFFNTNIDPVFLKGAEAPEFFNNFKGWIYGVLGSTMFMMGMLSFFIVNYAFPQKQRWAWTALTVAISLWFVVDSTVSALFGVYFNVIFNMVFFALYIIPLGLIKKYFTQTEGT